MSLPRECQSERENGTGAKGSPPSLVLAPESALGSHSCVALSSAQANSNHNHVTRNWQHGSGSSRLSGLHKWLTEVNRETEGVNFWSGRVNRSAGQSTVVNHNCRTLTKR